MSPSVGSGSISRVTSEKATTVIRDPRRTLLFEREVTSELNTLTSGKCAADHHDANEWPSLGGNLDVLAFDGDRLIDGHRCGV